jgi:tetratricopeptide (TPR) repeat protein
VDPIRDLLQRLKETQGDTRAQAALTTEFLVLGEPEPEQGRLRAALDAAAVLRWFDPDLLARLLEIPYRDARRRFGNLKQHSFVERYRGERDERYNLHESTRLGWRAKLAGESPRRFQALSARASRCFADSGVPSDRIEWIYHLLCGDPDLGASELEKLDREWAGSARPEVRYALATALQELVDTALVEGRARARSLLAIAWTRDDRGETAQLGAIAAEALALARASGDQAAEADARCLTGDIWQAQGKLDLAQAAFDEHLAIFRRLTEQDASNAGWQRDLAGAHSRVGYLLQAQGQLAAAQAACGEYLAILRRLAEQDPSNLGRRRELAVALGRVGEVRQAQGQLAAAHAAFDEHLAISRRLVEHDPSNARWHRDLAVAHVRIGDVLQEQGELAAAQVAFDEYLAISRRLAEQDPSNAGWQRDLALAHSRVGDVLQAQGKLAQAQAAFDQALAISRRLAELDPSNADWQRDLALAYLRVARAAAAVDKNAAALPLYDESLRIFAALVERAPGFGQWAEEKNIVEAELAALREITTSSPEGHA